jgi:hypothetical protein
VTCLFHYVVDDNDIYAPDEPIELERESATVDVDDQQGVALTRGAGPGLLKG